MRLNRGSTEKRRFTGGNMLLFKKQLNSASVRPYGTRDNIIGVRQHADIFGERENTRARIWYYNAFVLKNKDCYRFLSNHGDRIQNDYHDDAKEALPH